MTGSCPEQVDHNGFASRLRKTLGRGSGRASHSNLLYLRARYPDERVVRQDLSGALYTLGGVVLGLVAGAIGHQYQLLGALTSARDSVVLLFGVPALVGGGVGAFTAWWRARTKLAQALVTSEGFRQRLMSVERNQALWVSLSAVLHDVRNPLHNIQLLIESLEFPGTDTDRVREQVLEQIERINVRIRRVVNQIAKFSGEIARRPISLAEVLAEVSEMVCPLARQADVVLTVDAPHDAIVVADPKFLVQAIDHLILNSLQILSQQLPSAVRSLRVQIQEVSDEIEMWVEDNGPGLPAEVCERLFEPMIMTCPSGMGLGLAIAHALASAAGVPLSLGYTGATGTRFVLHFRSL
ncbi:HAMP domain-containing sensor histidine kinase [Acidiferrobacter sp.]|uniref:sensor histidine kinase n=1 Tax=Acidiferrobacter sp. TaxID=1872107 RepID=UPI00260A55E4|nr:HAMP domain-containing sensor histidine kinase [Acidiferrobacter sp.]